jgi:hypothetical protein
MFERGESSGARVAAEWDGGVTWIAHPDEEGQRASHAIRTDDGVWLFDPLDAPNVDDLISPLGEVAGITVLLNFHARDAGALARRYDVPVYIPEWMGRVEERVDAPVERYILSPNDEFQIFPCRPFPGWEEVFWYHEPTGTLAVGDTFGTMSTFLIEDERLGLEIFRRLQPPTEIAGLEPERILVGHGDPIIEDATAALEDALDGARRSFPSALMENGVESFRAFAGAVTD